MFGRKNAAAPSAEKPTAAGSQDRAFVGKFRGFFAVQPGSLAVTVRQQRDAGRAADRQDVRRRLLERRERCLRQRRRPAAAPLAHAARAAHRQEQVRAGHAAEQVET